MGIASRLAQSIASWYQGRYILPDNDPDSNLVFVLGHYERHWTAKTASALVGFYIEHWKWLWTTALALLGLSFSAHWFK